MKETEQTLLDQIKNDVAKEMGFDINTDVYDIYFSNYLNTVCERYATAKAKARMAWIKATERLPQHMVQVSLKISGMPYSGRYDYSLKRFICHNMGPSGLPIDDVEWLDESCEVFTREQVQASCEATLMRAAKNGDVDTMEDDKGRLYILQSSILDPSNIFIL